ncbi:MAG: hypothetical protein M3460_10930 [Actinomycetota bacterium]|nr:hypothetical protein [Actinomycetota bacterium]
MTTIEVDGTQAPVEPVTLFRPITGCEGPNHLVGHVDEGTRWHCASCQDTHVVQDPIHLHLTS